MKIIKSINYKYPRIFENRFSFHFKKWLENGFIDESYKYFTCPIAIKEWTDHYYEYFKMMRKEESKICIIKKGPSSLDALDYYTGYFYEKINGLLRYSSFENMKDSIMEKINLIELEINKFSLKENIIVVRRISNPFFRNYLSKNKTIKRGDILLDEGFLSTSLNLNYRLDENSEYKSLNDETLLIIKIPKGVNAIFLEALKTREEFELLLQRQSKMIVEDKIRILNNNIILTKVLV